MPDTPDQNAEAAGPGRPELHADPASVRGVATPQSASPLPYETSPLSTPIHATITRVNSGPVPTASEFADYEAAVPGTGKWFLDQSALDAQHVREMEKAGLKVTKREITLKHVVPAVTVGIALIVSGAIAIFAGPGSGVIAFATTIG